MRGVVLSLFPGADLLGRAFEIAGWCVVRGPDTLWGGDVRDFHVPPGRFDGVIGGPPCQIFSIAKNFTGSDGVDLIPEFVRLVDEAQPRWAVMENVPPAVKAPSAPGWPHVLLRDWDCGGLTFRNRAFWFYGLPPPPVPKRRGGNPAYSVLATSWKKRHVAHTHNVRYMHGHSGLSAAEAARLQGFPGAASELIDRYTAGQFLNKGAAEKVAVHLLGNGVPRAMGGYVARYVNASLDDDCFWAETGLPLFQQLELGEGG